MSLRLTIHSPDGGAFDVTFDDPEVNLGRASYCGVRLPYPVVSSHHLTIRGEQGDWRLADVGSTNGTIVDGRRLQPGEEIWIRDGQVAEIVDVRIEFHIVRDYVQGFTLAESGTMLRQMVQESAAPASEDELAFFEVLEGPAVGTRLVIRDDLDEAVIGPGDDADLRLAGLEGPVLRVEREGEGFCVEPVGEPLSVGGETVTERRRVRSSDRLHAGPIALLFVDPLEVYLRELDEEVAEEQPGEESVAEDEVAEEEPDGTGEEVDAPSTGLTPFEWFLLVVSVLVIIAGVAALLVILDVL